VALELNSGVKYSTPFHPSDEMMWNILHHLVKTEVAVPGALEVMNVQNPFFSIFFYTTHSQGSQS